MTNLQTALSEWKALPCSMSNAQVFAIGDVHGQAFALLKTLTAIAEIPRTSAVRRLIFLGDVIDRGPDNLLTLELIRHAAITAKVDDVVFLPGNHELMMMDALTDPHRAMDRWVDNGGDAVIKEVEPDMTGMFRREIAAKTIAAVGTDIVKQIQENPVWHQEGDLVFVHAGLNHAASFEDHFKQSRFFAKSSTHWAWIRAPFLDWTEGWGPDRSMIVIHGHTPAVTSHAKPTTFFAEADCIQSHSRVCLDGGATFGIQQVGWAEFALRGYRVGLTHNSKQPRSSIE